MILFHISPKRLNVIDPRKSIGRYKRSWFCNAEKLTWAINHIANHHQTTTLYLHIIHPNDGDTANKFSKIRRGIYTSTRRLYVRTAYKIEAHHTGGNHVRVR